jgi:hypothetical protein
VEVLKYNYDSLVDLKWEIFLSTQNIEKYPVVSLFGTRLVFRDI